MKIQEVARVMLPACGVDSICTGYHPGVVGQANGSRRLFDIEMAEHEIAGHHLLIAVKFGRKLAFRIFHIAFDDPPQCQ